jgi:hypothetical protein
MMRRTVVSEHELDVDGWATDRFGPRFPVRSVVPDVPVDDDGHVDVDELRVWVEAHGDTVRAGVVAARVTSAEQATARSRSRLGRL